MIRFLITILALFFISFHGISQTKVQKRALKKLAKIYKVGTIRKGAVSIRTKKNKLYGVATIDGNIIIEPKFAWISGRNNFGYYMAGKQTYSSPNDGGGSFLLEISEISVYDSIGNQIETDNLNNMRLQFRGGGTFRKDHLRTIKNSIGKMGLIDGSGKFLIKPSYDFIAPPNKEGLGYLFKNDVYGIYDLVKDSIGSISYIPPVNSNDIKKGLGFKGSNQPALNWKIKNGYIITSSDGIHFGLLNYTDGNKVFEEDYDYDFKQSEYSYLDNKTHKKGVLIKAKNSNRISLYDSKTKEIFFDEKDLGIDNINFFKPNDKNKWIRVFRRKKQNLYKIDTNSFLMDEFYDGISLLNNEIVKVKQDGVIRMYSFHKKKLLSMKGYDNVEIIPKRKFINSTISENTKHFYRVKIGNSYGVVDSFGKELTEIIYDNIPYIKLGIISMDKTEMLEDYLILHQTKQFERRNEKGQLTKWAETHCSVLNTITGKIILGGANEILYDGKYLIKVENMRHPISNKKIIYYTAYTLQGNQISDDRAYKI